MTTSEQYVIIAGLPRSGTTSLYTYLMRHPALCASTVKETQHFLPAGKGAPVAPLATYATFFQHCREQAYRLEASASYFYGGERTAQAIYDQLGSARIILILRDPAERLFSYFTHEKMYGNLPKAVVFEAFLDEAMQGRGAFAGLAPDSAESPLSSGYYINYLPGWQRYFAGSLRILFFDDLKRKPLELVQGVCTWLGIDPAFYAGFEFTAENRGALYKNKRLHMAARAVNTRFETFLRNHPTLKRALRSLYYGINEAETERPVLRPETYARLAALYQPYNVQLRAYLTQHGYPVSGWLARQTTGLEAG